MTERSIRRAAERRANKLARKQAQSQPSTETTEPRTNVTEPRTSVSGPRLAANQANSQLSTGPRTDEGKARSSVNAVKTALTGRTVLLPSDDAALYEHHLRQYTKEFNPATERESALVQSIADADWRLQRIPALELSLYARGRAEEANPDTKPGFTDLDTFLKYEKQFRNLQLQESRIRRHREKDLAELRATQQARITEEREQLCDAAKFYTAAKHDGKSWRPEDHGFEFSLDDVLGYIQGARAAHLYRESLKSTQTAKAAA